MGQDRSPERGAYLLARLQQAETALLGCPESERRAEELVKIVDLIRRTKAQLCATPRGLLHYFFSQAFEGEKVTFPDQTNLKLLNENKSLVERFGDPENLHAPLTDRSAAEIVSAAVASETAWEFVKEVCYYELMSERQIPMALRKFSAISMMGYTPKSPLGRRRSTNESRDSTVIQLAKTLDDYFALPLSRGVNSKSDSICRAISETMGLYGLNMTEDAIRKIIEKAKKSTDAP